MTPWQFHGVTPTLTDVAAIGRALIAGWPEVRAAIAEQYGRNARTWSVLEQMMKDGGSSRAYVHSQACTAAFFKRAGISCHTPDDRKLIVRAWVEVAWPVLAKGYVQELLADFAKAQAEVEAAGNCWTDPNNDEHRAAWDAAVLKQAIARKEVDKAKAEFPHVFAQFAARFPESTP